MISIKQTRLNVNTVCYDAEIELQKMLNSDEHLYEATIMAEFITNLQNLQEFDEIGVIVDEIVNFPALSYVIITNWIAQLAERN